MILSLIVFLPLAGALLVGASFARGLAFALGVPAIGIHHLEGHLLSPLLSARPPQFPFVALLVFLAMMTGGRGGRGTDRVPVVDGLLHGGVEDLGLPEDRFQHETGIEARRAIEEFAVEHPRVLRPQRSVPRADLIVQAIGQCRPFSTDCDCERIG